MIAAFDDRDVEQLIGHMTEDVVLQPSAFITGTAEYIGHEAERSGMAGMVRQLTSAEERVRVRTDAFYVDAEDDNKILTLASVTILRASSEEFGTDIAYGWTLRGNQVCKIRAWLNHDEGLSQLGAPIKVA